MVDTSLIRIAAELASAAICIILMKFMIKPYQLTKESRYLGLPLGFGLLGLSFVISAIVYILGKPTTYNIDLFWFQSLMKVFAFAFLAVTYNFSNKPLQKARFLPEIAFGLLIAIFVALFLITVAFPKVASQDYTESQVFIRILNTVFLTYVAAQALKSHIKKPDPTTIWIPIGFGLLAVSQYSSIFWYTDLSLASYFGEIIIRLVGLSIFLIVSYRTFYSSGNVKEEGS